MKVIYFFLFFPPRKCLFCEAECLSVLSDFRRVIGNPLKDVQGIQARESVISH